MGKVISYTDKIHICGVNANSNNTIYSELVHTRYQYSLIVLTITGDVKFQIDQNDYELTDASVLALYSFDHLTVLTCSPDYEGWIVFISNEFLSVHTEGKGGYVKNSLLRLNRRSVISLSIQEKNILLKRIDCLKEQILHNKHLYYNASIGNMLEGLFMDINSLLQITTQKDVVQCFSNRYDIVDRFLNQLHVSASKEHCVSFYAQKIGISTPYLSIIVKEYTGKTVRQWIKEFLIHESVCLLQKPSLTIQEIAYKLNFADQSSFGKFFKKHMLVSPQKYRKENFF